MKKLLKGVKKFMKDTTEKIITGVDKILANDIKCRKMGILVFCCGAGLGLGMIAMSYVK